MADPHHFHVDTDPYCHFHSDSDPTSHLSVNPRSGSCSSFKVMRICDHWSVDTPRLRFCQHASIAIVHGSILILHSSCISTLMRIRILLLIFMRTWLSFWCGSGSATLAVEAPVQNGCLNGRFLNSRIKYLISDVFFSLGGGDALPSEAVPSLHCGTTREDPAASIPGHVQVPGYHG